MHKAARTGHIAAIVASDGLAIQIVGVDHGRRVAVRGYIEFRRHGIIDVKNFGVDRFAGETRRHFDF